MRILDIYTLQYNYRYIITDNLEEVCKYFIEQNYKPNFTIRELIPQSTIDLIKDKQIVKSIERSNKRKINSNNEIKRIENLMKSNKSYYYKLQNLQFLYTSLELVEPDTIKN